MKSLIHCVIGLGLLFVTAGLAAFQFHSISHYPGTLVCENYTGEQIPDFSAEYCQQKDFDKIDPQGKSLWMQLTFEWPLADAEIAKPYGLYFYGKASSQLYLNGQLLGANGTPAQEADDEVAGRMDAVFHLPEQKLQTGTNRLAIYLSSHHGVLELSRPLHIIGIATYGDPKDFVQQYSTYGLVLLGCLLIGAVYFGAHSFNPLQRPAAVYFMLLSGFAASQLAAELSRGLVSYDYPWHDWRLIAIAFLSLCFGVTLLAFIAHKFSSNRLHWSYGGALLTTACVILTPGFDVKTSLATFIPIVIAQALLLYCYFKQADKLALGYTAGLAVFLLTMIFGLNYFHEIIFYLLVSLLLCYLFVEQAREFNQEQLKRRNEEKQVAKLAYKLEQASQQQAPDSIKISSAGKVEVISTAELNYCQAAGDYVELHLHANKQTLYSGSMKSLEQQLPETFLRVHRSYLVNLDKVRSLKSNSNQSSGTLVLDCGTEIPVSRRILPTVRNAVAS